MQHHAEKRSGHAPHYQYVQDADQLPDTLLCTVCHDPIQTHASCPGCKAGFCGECITRWFSQQKREGVSIK